MVAPENAAPAGARVVVVGAGGVIGSHLIPHLARNRGIGTLVLIDSDDYDSGNLASQDILPPDVGRPKSQVQAARARRIRPELLVTPLVADVEALPVGWLRADAVLTCVDSRRARQHVNLVTRRLGVPWIDAGVLGSQLLARIDVILPGPEGACLECRWSDADYAALEQRYPCHAGQALAAPTASPSSLGALAAALQAIECEKQLGSDASALATGEQVVIDARGQTLWRTAHRRNPDCRLDEHEPWRTEPLGEETDRLTLQTLFDRARGALAETVEPRGDLDTDLRLRVEPHRFATSWICEGCGRTDRAIRLEGRATPTDIPCPECMETLHPTGLGLVDFLDESRLTAAEATLPIHTLGLEPGDVVTVVGLGGAVHYALTDEGESRHVA